MKNYPKDFLIQMTELLGEHELASFLDALGESTPTSIRYNPYKNLKKPLEKIVPWASFAYYLKERPLFTADPHFHAGAYYVQEAASMFLEQAFNQHIDIASNLRILDLCAAPGGKSTLISGLINDNSLLVSNEVIRSRAFILSENIQKWGKANIWVSNNDPSEISYKLPHFFDVVTIDAPCSGEGMFRKSKKSIEEWSNNDVRHCSLRQQRILHDIWKSLRPGGILIYSTCTYNKTENEDNLIKFREHHAFDSLKLITNEQWQITETLTNGIYAYRFFPHKTKGEGFFISVLKKEGNSNADLPRIKNNPFSKPQKVAESISDWVENLSEFVLVQKKERIKAVPKSLEREAMVLESLNLFYSNAELAEINRKGFSHLHSAALWTGLNRQNFISNELDLEESLKYLKLDNIDIQSVAQKDGWQLLTFDNLALGWIKKLKNRVNNYYPKEWKIRLSTDKLR